jgi:hypothetical protein
MDTMMNVCVDEEAESRINAARHGARMAVAAYRLGLPVGETSLMTTGAGWFGLCSDLLEMITKVVGCEQTCSLIPPLLLAQYAVLLCAADRIGGWCTSYLHIIARHVLEASIPCISTSNTDDSDRAWGVLIEAWIAYLLMDEQIMAEEMNGEIETVAKFLSASGGLTGDEMHSLLDRMCVARLSV